MAKRSMSVEEHYSVGRIHPRGRVTDDGAENSISRSPSMKSNEVQRNQAPEDAHGPGYSNDCSGWTRGARGEPTGNNETAEGKPSFDKGQSYRRADKGNDWGSGSDPATIRKPEPNKP
jgi:hypothetical protein